MTISNEAVEAAARALYTGQPWECMEPEYQEAMRAEARAALEASAATIRAEARAEVLAEMLEDADAESKHANWQNERHTANLVHDWIRTWDDEQRSRTERGGQ